jgi:hypothetical protein
MNSTLFVLAVLLAQAAPQYGEEEKRGESRQEAYRRGFKEGFDEGYRKGVEEADKRAAAAANAAAAAAAEASKRPTGPITVSSAVYGTSSKSCNAMRYVAPKANGKRTASIDVTNNMCGDPAYGERKSLEITYICGSVAKTASAYEHRTAYLDCSS